MSSNTPTVSPALDARIRIGLGRCLGAALFLGVLSSGCRTPRPEEDFAGSFDAPKVAALCHEAYRVAREATFWAWRDLEFGAYQPTRPDWEVVVYLDRLTWQIPWVARAAEKKTATPRGASKRAYDLAAYDAVMLRSRYRPASFAPSTCARIERLLGLIDEVSSCYQLRKPGTSRPTDDRSDRQRAVPQN